MLYLANSVCKCALVCIGEGLFYFINWENVKSILMTHRAADISVFVSLC